MLPTVSRSQVREGGALRRVPLLSLPPPGAGLPTNLSSTPFVSPPNRAIGSHLWGITRRVSGSRNGRRR
jgi:hypothetical protein